MDVSNHNIDPALTNDPLMDTYHMIDSAPSPEEMQARRHFHRRTPFLVDFRK